MKPISNVVPAYIPSRQEKSVLIFMLLLGFLFIVVFRKDDVKEAPKVSDVKDPLVLEITNDTGVMTLMGTQGIILDTRPYFKKGQPIAKLKITPTNSTIFEPVMVEVDQITNYATFKLEIKDLSDTKETVLTEEINIEVVLLDENEKELFKETLKNTLFKDHNNTIVLRGDNMSESNTVIDLYPDTPYFL